MYARRIWRRLRGHSRDDHVPACGCSVATPGNRPPAARSFRASDSPTLPAGPARAAIGHGPCRSADWCGFARLLRRGRGPQPRGPQPPAPVVSRVPGPQPPAPVVGVSPVFSRLRRSSAVSPVLSRRSVPGTWPPAQLASVVWVIESRRSSVGPGAVQNAIGQAGRISMGWVFEQLSMRRRVQAPVGRVADRLRPNPSRGAGSGQVGAGRCRYDPGDGYWPVGGHGRGSRGAWRVARGGLGQTPARRGSRRSAGRRSAGDRRGRVARGARSRGPSAQRKTRIAHIAPKIRNGPNGT